MSILAADLEVAVSANVDDALKKLSSVDAATQKTASNLSKLQWPETCGTYMDDFV